MQPRTDLTVNGYRYHLLVATTPATQAKGLGDRASLPLNEGMLFVFPDEGVRCFWMKNTHFPLDIIWLNAHKQVVHMEANVSPATYPNAFCPPQVARYVIELNAGQAQRAGMQLGQVFTF